MPVEKWSDSIVVLHMADDPQFSEDIEALIEGGAEGVSTVLDFSAVHFVNSSNIAKLLRLRRHLLTQNQKLLMCNVGNQVWGTILITGLDKVFEFSDNVPTALATLQMSQSQEKDRERVNGK